MKYEEAADLLAAMHAASGEDEQLLRPEHDVILHAVACARIRADCRLAARERRVAIETERTSKHTCLIDACDILSRNQAEKGRNNAWRRRLGDDRQVIGDFGCFIHCILGIQVR